VQKIQRDTDIPAVFFYGMNMTQSVANGQKCKSSTGLSLDLFEHVMKVDDTNGFVRGRRENAIFIPNAYRDDQISKIRQFVESNDYIGGFP
jgi:hypothetical protein